MNASNLIISLAAAMLTLASLGATTRNLPADPVADQIASIAVVDLAPVQVHASAAELRAAALLPAAGLNLAQTSAAELRPPLIQTAPVRLLESAVAMPYYSFGDTLGRTSKE